MQSLKEDAIPLDKSTDLENFTNAQPKKPRDVKVEDLETA